MEGIPIEKRKRWILALGAVALATLGKVRDGSPAGSYLLPPLYATRCAVVESGSVDGFVTNRASVPARVFGEVRFLFVADGAASRPDLLVQTDAEVPAGETMRIARARLSAPLREGEDCRLDVEPSLRKE
jgi:hypothetical protein